MPIRLRKFVFNKLAKYYEAQNPQNNTPQEPSKVLTPPVVINKKSDYTTVSTKK